MTDTRPSTPQTRPRVAHFGSAGAFSHMAAERAFGSGADYIERATIADVFECVERWEADFGVVPVENSTEGGVTTTLDCLLESNLIVEREVVLEIAQCLLAAEAGLDDVRRVYSHPQALAQCREWLRAHLPEAATVPCGSTTDAAIRAATEPGSAAIASSLAAKLYGLEVLASAIQDQPNNVTRFFVIGKTPTEPSGSDKTSIVFATTHTRGALCQVLNVLANHDLNLTRIESRPAPSKPWEYVFFVDLEGHRAAPALATALAEAAARSSMFKVLGSYPRAA